MMTEVLRANPFGPGANGSNTSPSAGPTIEII
jgi:hypothetical protein